MFLYGLAIVSTCFRLFHRMRTRRLWWDDFWAFFALTATIMLMTVFLVLPTGPDLLAKPMEIQLFSYWATLVSFTCALWAARATVAVTIVRLLPEGRMRLCSKMMAGIFGMMWITLMVQKFFICGKFSLTSWTCHTPKSTGYLELSTDITADAWLLGAPAYMLLQMNLSRRHHRLIQVIFGCDILVTATSIVHSVFILRQDQSAVGLSGHFQVSTSLIVSNLLVVVTYIYRIFCNDVDIESSNDSTSESKHDNSLATRASNIVSVNGAGTTSRLTFTVISTTNTFNSSHPFRSSRFSEPTPNRHSAAAERIIKTYFT